MTAHSMARKHGGCAAVSGGGVVIVRGWTMGPGARPGECRGKTRHRENRTRRHNVVPAWAVPLGGGADHLHPLERLRTATDKHEHRACTHGAWEQSLWNVVVWGPGRAGRGTARTVFGTGPAEGPRLWAVTNNSRPLTVRQNVPEAGKTVNPIEGNATGRNGGSVGPRSRREPPAPTPYCPPCSTV